MLRRVRSFVRSFVSWLSLVIPELSCLLAILRAWSLFLGGACV